MREEPPDSEVRENSRDFSKQFRVFLIGGLLRGDGAMMDQSWSKIEIVFEARTKSVSSTMIPASRTFP